MEAVQEGDFDYILEETATLGTDGGKVDDMVKNEGRASAGAVVYSKELNRRAKMQSQVPGLQTVPRAEL